jgi:hypothetical protein
MEEGRRKRESEKRRTWAGMAEFDILSVETFRTYKLTVDLRVVPSQPGRPIAPQISLTKPGDETYHQV